MNSKISELGKLHRLKKVEIIQRLGEFKAIWSDGSDCKILSELLFCLLTPQSKARVCGRAVQNICDKNKLTNGTVDEIREELVGVRFKNNKSKYFIIAREKFFNDNKLLLISKLNSFIHNAPLIIAYTERQNKADRGGTKVRSEAYLTYAATTNRGSNEGMRNCVAQYRDVYQMRDYLVQNVVGFGYKEASHFLRNLGFGQNIAILDRHILKNLRDYGVIDEVPKTISKVKYLDMEERMRRFAKRIKIPLSHLDLLFWYKEAGEIYK